MLKKFVGPEKATVVVNGVSYGEIEPGESIVVPDEIAARVKWPQTLWADVAKKKPRTQDEDSKQD